MRKICAVIILFLVTGCTIGPDYHPPTIDLPKEWYNAAPSESSAIPPKDLAWWKNFNDPMLDRLIEEAVQSNLELETALGKIRQTRANLSAAQAGLFPSLTAGGSVTHSHFSRNLQRSSQNNDAFAAGFDASWEIDIFGGARRAEESALATFESTIESSRSVLLTLIAEVAQNYINLRNYQQQLQVLKEITSTWHTYVDLKKDIYQAGLSTHIDVNVAETALTQAQAQIPILETYIKTTLHQLSVLLGKDPTYLYQCLETITPIPTASTVVLSGLPSTLLQQRPDIRQAERELAATTANIGVATASLFPKFNLTGNFGWDSAKGSNLFSPNSQSWSFGPSFILPLIDFGRIRAQIDAQEALRDQAFSQYKAIILTALKDVENGLVSFANEDRRLNHLAKAIQDNEISYQLHDKRHLVGLETALEALQAKIIYLLSKQDYLNSQATRSLNLVALYKALGGGWDFVH